MRALGWASLVLGLAAACGDNGATQDDTDVTDDTDVVEPDAAPAPDAVDVCTTCDPLATCDDGAATPCTCPAGFEGDGTIAGTGCTNIDECTVGGACVAAVDGGVCDDSDGSFTCSCAVGYEGDGTLAGTGCTNIDECTVDAPCVDAADGGACTDEPGSFTCSCVAGYEGDGDPAGTGCTNIDECTVGGFCVDAAEGGTCVDDIGTYTCGCADGYAGDGAVAGTGCTDIDECAALTPACIAGACVNEVGTFHCEAYITTSPFQNFGWYIDPINYNNVGSFSPTVAGFTSTGANAVAIDPTDGTIYAVLKLSAVSGRVLVTMDPVTGAAEQVGNLGDAFASLTFRADGQLFGVTGNGASVPETLYEIDKTTGVKTLAVTLGNGADGETIVHNPDDGFFYHFSGNGTIVFEKIMDAAPYTITNIPIVGTTSGETFAARYLGEGQFLVTNISSTFNLVHTDGTWGAAFGSTPDDLRGLVRTTIPTVTLEPRSGPAAGGYAMTLTGTFAFDIGAVTVNGATAADFVKTATGVTFTMPTGTAGPATVVVQGASTGLHRFADAFTYE